jgi:hypothetical protein
MSDRFLTYQLWRQGLLPDYLPTWLDYWLFRDDCYGVSSSGF